MGKEQGCFNVARALIRGDAYPRTMRLALIELIAEARFKDGNGLKRGQLYFNIRDWAKKWEVTKSTAARWMKRFEDDEVISWSRGKGELCQMRHKHGTRKRDTEAGHGASVVTILNYDKYQAPISEVGREGGTRKRDTLIINDLNLRTNVLKNKEQEPPYNPPVGDSLSTPKRQKGKKRITPPTNPDKIRELLGKIDLDKYRERYPSLNIDSIFEDFYSDAMGGLDEQGPYNHRGYKNFSSAFHTWCKRREEQDLAKRKVQNRDVYAIRELREKICERECDLERLDPNNVNGARIKWEIAQLKKILEVEHGIRQ